MVRIAFGIVTAMIGGLATGQTGAFLAGPFGARRLAWMTLPTNITVIKFAVFFIDEVDNGYPSNTEGRARWNRDVEEYEELAAEVTRQELWHTVRMLLVHVETSPGADRILLPIVPSGVTTYPSHINGPDDVTIPRRDLNFSPNACNFDVFRFVLEQGGSPVLPRTFYFDTSGSMAADDLRPGWTEWVDSSPVPITIHNVDGGEAQLPSEQWVKWASDVLEGVLG
jgi:hypothetical protein